jgi:dihydroorotate dehydrogenase (NAD+) catalytic subunit
MMKKKIPTWSSQDPPLYDITKSYAANAENGPFFHGEIPKRPETPPDQYLDFLGFSIRSPLGVPAGPLLNSRWVELAGKLGFDLPVYKTIRSFAHPGHALPNMIFVEPKNLYQAYSIEKMPDDLDHLTVTNSFGMPSKSPDFLLQDIEKAQRSLQKGQLLIVSVVGTPNQGVSFAEDFVQAALLAKEAGAKVIEANFSCPNVGKAEGCLYLSAETVKTFASLLVKAIHPIPLILKVGLFETIAQMQSMFIAAAQAGVRAICGINSVSMQVTDQQGHSALGKERLLSGVCGAGILHPALDFIRKADQINRKEQLDLTLMGCGGVVHPSHFDEFLKAGAKIAMSATGMMWDPYLAMRWHQKHF